MTWLFPALLFFGCVLGAGGLIFLVLTTWADGWIESKVRRSQSDATAEERR